LDVKTVNKINSLKNFDAIIMMVNHRDFNKIDLTKLIKNSKIKIILDNSNYFKNKKKLIPNKINYIQTGQAGWLN
jgi:UDP-N-acetyl-D-mannosaminuronate dehydrogenase